MNLRALFETVLDVILPPRARMARTRVLSPERIPLTPASHELLGVTITTLMDYQKNDVRDLVQSLKYDRSGHAAKLCASVLAEYLTETLADEKLFSQKRVSLVPVPLHAARRRERGFNQIALVLEALPQEFRDGNRAALAPQLLTRTRPTKPQTRLPRSERLSNVAGAFALADNAEVKGARIILIDDVTTTGATLANAAQPLRRAGAKVTLLALARA